MCMRILVYSLCGTWKEVVLKVFLAALSGDVLLSLLDSTKYLLFLEYVDWQHDPGIFMISSTSKYIIFKKLILRFSS